MSIRSTVTCDRPGCTRHTSADSARADGFITVDWDGTRLDYCSIDCLTAGMSAQSPLRPADPQETP